MLDRIICFNGFSVDVYNGRDCAHCIDTFEFPYMQIEMIDEKKAVNTFLRDASPATLASMGQGQRYDGSPHSTIRFSRAGRVYKFFLEHVEDGIRALVTTCC